MLRQTVRARLLVTTAALVTLTTAGTAFAQAQPASPPASGANQTSNEREVVVTAQKREQSLTSIPVAISAFTSLKRDEVGIDSVQDMTNFTPGLVYNTGNDRVTLRGIGRYTNQLAADSSVGVYEDGAFETFTVKAGNDTLFVDRIEVLRGPQGTLYGRNSIGGAINIISKRPTKTPYAEFRASYDNYNQHIEEGAVSGPLTDTIQYRLAGSKTDQGTGYFTNLAPGGKSEGNVRDEYYLEAQLQGQWGQKFDWWAKAFTGGWDNLGGNAGGRITNQVITAADGKTKLPYAQAAYALGVGSTGALSIGETGDSLVPALGAYTLPGVTNITGPNAALLNPGNLNIRDIYELQPQTVKLHNYKGVDIQLNYHFSGFDVKYIGSAQGYAYETHEPWGDGDQLDTGVQSYVSPVGITIFPQSQLYYGEYHWLTTNEVNIISNNDGPLQWVTGFYNYNEGFKQPEQVVQPGQTQLAAPYSILALLGAGKLVAAAPNPTQADVYYQAVNGGETFAGFGQVDYKVVPAVKVTAGLRYSYDAKWGVDSMRLNTLAPQLGVNLPIALDLTAVGLPAGANGVLGSASPGATAWALNTATGFYSRKLGGDWGGVTGTLGVQWDPDRDTNLYAKYSRGYKSGGFNAGSGASNPRTNPEDSNDYQVGFKKNIGRQFTVAIDAFYDQYYNAQIPISVLNGGLLSSQFYNVPEARSDGVEIETTYSPTRALQFIFNYGYNDTEIINSGCVVNGVDPLAVYTGAKIGGCAASGGVQPQNLKGNQLPNAPENKLAFNANYTFDLPQGALIFSGSYIYRDAQYGSIFNTNYNLAPSWDQVDLRATFKSADNHWTLIAYGKNIFNTVGYGAGAGGTPQVTPGGVVTWVKSFTLNPPAVGGVELQYKF